MLHTKENLKLRVLLTLKNIVYRPNIKYDIRKNILGPYTFNFDPVIKMYYLISDQEDELILKLLIEKQDFIATHVLKNYVDILARLKAKGVFQQIELDEIYKTKNSGEKAGKIVHLFKKHRSSMIAIYVMVKEAGNQEVANCLGDIMTQASHQTTGKYFSLFN